MRTVITDACTYVSYLVDLTGDGYFADPYVDSKMGIIVRIFGSDMGRQTLKWSNVKDVLLALREYLVVQGHLYRVRFAITKGDGVSELLGFGIIG